MTEPTDITMQCKKCGRLLVAKTTMKLRKCAVCGARTPVEGAAVSAPASTRDCVGFINESVPNAGLDNDATTVVKRRARPAMPPGGGE